MRTQVRSLAPPTPLASSPPPVLLFSRRERGGGPCSVPGPVLSRLLPQRCFFPWACLTQESKMCMDDYQSKGKVSCAQVRGMVPGHSRSEERGHPAMKGGEFAEHFALLQLSCPRSQGLPGAGRQRQHCWPEREPRPRVSRAGSRTPL